MRNLLIRHTPQPLRRRLTWGVGILAAAVLVNANLRRARVCAARVASVTMSEGACYAHVMWRYTPGGPPVSVIVDVTASNGASGSFTTDGEMTSGRVAMAQPFSGPYTLTFTATYRILSVARTAIWTFQGAVEAVER